MCFVVMFKMDVPGRPENVWELYKTSLGRFSKNLKL